MRLSVEFLLRILGAIVGSILLAIFGNSLAKTVGYPSDLFIVIFGLLGAISGFHSRALFHDTADALRAQPTWPSCLLNASWH